MPQRNSLSYVINTTYIYYSLFYTQWIIPQWNAITRPPYFDSERRMNEFYIAYCHVIHHFKSVISSSYYADIHQNLLLTLLLTYWHWIFMSTTLSLQVFSLNSWRKNVYCVWNNSCLFLNHLPFWFISFIFNSFRSDTTDNGNDNVIRPY